MAVIQLKENYVGIPTSMLAFSHRVVFAGVKQLAAAASVTISLAGLLATDIVLTTFKSLNTNSRYVITVAPAADAVVVTFNGATTVDDYLFYVVLRAA